MSTTKKNLMYNILYQLLIIFIPLITSPYLSRVLGASGIGIYSFIHSISSYFVLFGMLGISNYGNKTVAAFRKNKIELKKNFWSIYFLQIITTSFSVTIYIIYIIFISKFKIYSIIQLIYVLSCIFDISWLFFGLGKFKITVLRNAVIKILSLFLIFLLVKNQQDLGIYILIMSLGTMLSQLYLWVYVKKEVGFYIPKMRELKQHIRPIIILFVPVISYSIYKIMDKIMLGSMCTMNDVGFYENAEKIITIPQSIITAIGIVMISKMSNMVVKEKKENVNKYIAQSMKYIVILAIACYFGLFAVGPEFAPIYFGKEFIKTGEIIKIMSIVLLFVSVASVIRTQYLIPYEKNSIYLISTIVGAIANLILNLILIPQLGVNGAVIGTIVAEFLVMFVQLLGVRKELNVLLYCKNSIIPLINGILMLISIRIVSNFMAPSIFSLIFKIIFGIIVYGGLTFIYLKVTKDQILEEELIILSKKLHNNKNVLN